MKVVMICDLYDKNANYQENLLAKYYSKNKHEVTIIASIMLHAFDYYEKNYDKAARESVTFTEHVKLIRKRYKINLFNNIRKFGNVLEILRDEKPDVIFVHNIHFNLKEAVQYKKQSTSCKILLDYHGDYSNSARNHASLIILHKVLRKHFLHKYISDIEKIFYVTPGSGKFLNQVYEISYNRMELLPLGSDTDLVKQAILGSYGREIREELDIRPNDIVIFTGGKLDPAKKTHLLIEAVKMLNDHSIHLIIIGDSGKESIGYKARLLDISEGNKNIHFIGWVNGAQVYQYMSACDLAVFPASQSVLWQQAISMGLPLIVGITENQGISYLNLHNCIFEIDESELKAETLLRYIQEIIEDKFKLEQLKQNALRTSDELLNFDKIIAKTLE